MYNTKSKPLCLLVGGTSQKHDYLAELLKGEVHFSAQDSEMCIDSARTLGAKFAVVFWNRQTNEVAHRLSKNLPGLHVLVENNSLAFQGQVERNGFASIFDARQQLEHVAAAIRQLSRDGRPTTRVGYQSRGPDLAKSFIAHLPALQASVSERQKLGNHLLNSMVQATQAAKGILFHASVGQSLFEVLCKTGANQHRSLTPIVTNSCLASSIQEIGTAVHGSDADIPEVIENHLSQLGCNLLIPLESSQGFCGWMLLKVHQAAQLIDYQSLQSMAYFAAESFRTGENIREMTLREAELQAGLSYHMDAVLIVNKSGKVTFKSDKESLLRFKKTTSTSFESLACGQLRGAIRRCIDGKKEEQTWNFDKNGLRKVTVVRLTGDSIFVAIRPEYESTKVVKIDANVWSELIAQSDLSLWRTHLRPEAVLSELSKTEVEENYGLKNLLSRFANLRHVSTSVPDHLSDVSFSPERFEALEAFLSGLLYRDLKAIQLTAKLAANDSIHLEICCERLPSISSHTKSIEDAQKHKIFEIGILSLISTASHLKREICSLGDRWTIVIAAEKHVQPSLVKALPVVQINGLSKGDRFLKTQDSPLAAV